MSLKFFAQCTAALVLVSSQLAQASYSRSAIACRTKVAGNATNEVAFFTSGPVDGPHLRYIKVDGNNNPVTIESCFLSANSVVINGDKVSLSCSTFDSHKLLKLELIGSEFVAHDANGIEGEVTGSYQWGLLKKTSVKCDVLNRSFANISLKELGSNFQF